MLFSRAAFLQATPKKALKEHNKLPTPLREAIQNAGGKPAKKAAPVKPVIEKKRKIATPLKNDIAQAAAGFARRRAVATLQVRAEATNLKAQRALLAKNDCDAE